MRSVYILLGLSSLTALHSSRASSETSEATCSNGILGLQNIDVCCETQCGACGGVGCDSRPGGPEACCHNIIIDSGVMCSTTSAAPCIIDLCSNGVLGLQNRDVCCETQCGTCGGTGCQLRAGGPAACCHGTIQDSGVMCSTTSVAPCIIDPTCSNGVIGLQNNDVCCETQCGTCGGVGCDSRPGGPVACCHNTIIGGGVMCSTTSEAPCIIEDLIEEH